MAPNIQLFQPLSKHTSGGGRRREEERGGEVEWVLGIKELP